MNPKLVEFALKKQRLQIRAESQRADMMRRLEGVESTLNLVDRLTDYASDTLRRARENALLLIAGAALIILLRPRRAFRLVRRVWLGWLVYRNFGRRFGPILATLSRAIGSAARS
jgi:hypothetical protein